MYQVVKRVIQNIQESAVLAKTGKLVKSLDVNAHIFNLIKFNLIKYTGFPFNKFINYQKFTEFYGF